MLNQKCLIELTARHLLLLLYFSLSACIQDVALLPPTGLNHFSNSQSASQTLVSSPEMIRHFLPCPSPLYSSMSSNTVNSALFIISSTSLTL